MCPGVVERCQKATTHSPQDLTQVHTPQELRNAEQCAALCADKVEFANVCVARGASQPGRQGMARCEFLGTMARPWRDLSFSKTLPRLKTN